MTTLRGTMLTPGVSRNGRLYTPELIQKAHDRLAERLATGDAPVTMLTHHLAGDDSTRIVGQVTKVGLKDQALTFEAELADTSHAATIKALATGKNPILRNVSIRGAWIGPVSTQTVDGAAVETAEDLEIDGLDFTKSPGVTGARIETTESHAPHGRTRVVESLERVEITETVTPRTAETVKAVFADPGYRPDRIRRYPLTSASDATHSWARISEHNNASAYTPNQLKRVRGRIKAALTRHGVPMTETTLATQPVSEGSTRLGDIVECYMDGTGTAGFSISAYNGPLTVNVSAYNGIEPADLAGVATAAMSAALQAVKSLDPDVDGDIDTGTAGGDDEATGLGYGKAPDDDAMETHSGAPTTDPKEAPVAETTTTPTPAPDGTPSADGGQPLTLTQAQLDEAIATAVKAAVAEALPTTPVTKTTEDGVTETVDEPAAPTVDEATIRAYLETDEGKAILIEQARQQSLIVRKGLVTRVDTPDKPLHEMSDDELRAHNAKVWEAVIPAVRA